jgi:hypothetical protein
MEKYLKYKIKYLKLKQFGSESYVEQQRRKTEQKERLKKIRERINSKITAAKKYLNDNQQELEKKKFSDILESLMISLSRYNFITQILNKEYDPLPNIFLETKYKEYGLDITKVCSFTETHFILSSPICDKISKILNEYFYKYNEYYYNLNDAITVLIKGNLTLTQNWEDEYSYNGDHTKSSGTESLLIKNPNFTTKFHEYISSLSFKDETQKKEYEEAYEFILKSSSDSSRFKSMIEEYQRELIDYFNLIFSCLDSLFTYLKNCNCGEYINLDIDFESIISEYRPNDIKLFKFHKKEFIVSKYKIRL